MRMLPSRYAGNSAVSVVKKLRAEVARVSIPSKGLSLDAQTGAADPQLAGVLTNFYVDDDRISARAGFQKLCTCAGAQPIEHLIPFYGLPERLAAATNLTLCDAGTGTVMKSGFTSDDWYWSSFANLGDKQYTVMVNGADGVWAWDGLATAGLITPVAISKIEKTNPARCTVAAADIAKFTSGITVIIAGADTAHTKANGAHRITNVNTVPNTFELVGVDLSGAATDQTTGTMTATLQGSFEKMGVLPPTGNTWLDPNSFQIVIAHQNRLFFADKTNLAVYYLPIQQKDGVLAVLPLSAIFKRGGAIKAMYTWSVDAGMGMDDQLVIFTTNGEAAIYSGVDPASDFSLVGVFRFDPPMSKHSVLNYGGELYVLIPTGVTPMTAMIKAGKEGLEDVDRSVVPIFLQSSINFLDQKGWELFLNPSTGRLFANMPLGGGRYQQMIRHMPKAVWSLFSGVPARCWGWVNPYVYFGDDAGNIYQMHPSFQTDAGAPIRVAVQMAWNQYKSPVLKHFKMILPYIVTNGQPIMQVDVKVDYDTSAPVNQPETSGYLEGGATWDTADWDTSDWVGGVRNYANWTGVGGLGRVGAVSLSAQLSNCSFAVLGWDVLFEKGSVFG